MLLYRVIKRIYALSAFTGEGGKYSAGRWHHKGHLIVYTSDSPGNALVEACNAYPNFMKILHKLVCIKVDIPDDVRVKKIDAADLPRGWKNYPPLPETRDLGTNFLDSKEALLLAVPSSIFPEGCRNYLINPLYPDFKRIKISEPKDFNFRYYPKN